LLRRKIGLVQGSIDAARGSVAGMQLHHMFAVRSVLFDEPNVVAHAGLVSTMTRH